MQTLALNSTGPFLRIPPTIGFKDPTDDRDFEDPTHDRDFKRDYFRDFDTIRCRR